jgi:hypothetical protein
MGADLGAFFKDADSDLPPRFDGKLLQPDGGRQARRAGADDDYVVIH